MRSSILFAVIRAVYRYLTDSFEISLKLINSVSWLNYYELRRLHLKLLWITAQRLGNYGKFRNFLDLYLQEFPKVILDFRYEANCGQSPSEIERYQNLLLQEQERCGGISSSARLISVDAFLGNSNVHAFVDAYIKSRILSEFDNKDLFVCLNRNQFAKVKNATMLSYWSKYFEIIDEKRARLIFGRNLDLYTDDITWAINVDGKMKYIEHAKSEVQTIWDRERRLPLLKCETEHVNRGQKAMAVLGLPPDAWFVTLHVRDNGAKIGSWQASDPYDDYRNADIDTYKEAISAIAALGGYIVRVGDPLMKPLDDLPNLIDYAHSSIRSSDLDIYLFTMCKFFVGTASGPILTAIVFGTPTVATNFAPVAARLYASNCITLPKGYYSRTLGRPLTLREALAGPLSSEYDGRRYQSQQISMIDNSASEIKDAVLEMNQIVDGVINYSVTDERLQIQSGLLYKKYSGYGSLGRLGQSYLGNLNTLGLLE